jgi:hypothetical protein
MTMRSKSLAAGLLALAALALSSPVSAEEALRLNPSTSPKLTTLDLAGTDTGADLVPVQWRGGGYRGYRGYGGYGGYRGGYGGYRGYYGGYRGYGYGGYRGYYGGYRGYGRYGYGGYRGYGYGGYRGYRGWR